MFMNTMAVGPFEPGAICCGAMDALPLLHCDLCGESKDVDGQMAVARVVVRKNGARSAIVRANMNSKACSMSMMWTCHRVTGRIVQGQRTYAVSEYWPRSPVE